MKNLCEELSEKAKKMEYLLKDLENNRYPKTIYKKKLKKLNEIRIFIYKYGVL